MQFDRYNCELKIVSINSPIILIPVTQKYNQNKTVPKQPSRKSARLRGEAPKPLPSRDSRVSQRSPLKNSKLRPPPFQMLIGTYVQSASQAQTHKGQNKSKVEILEHQVPH